MSLTAERSELQLSTLPAEYDKPREACGVFGVYAPGLPVAEITYWGLHTQQNRGQEGAGIFASDGTKSIFGTRFHKELGKVRDVFTGDIIRQLDEGVMGERAILAVGHNRYSTTGSNERRNLGPFVVKDPKLDDIAVAHNGNLVNAKELRAYVESCGYEPQSDTDSELIAASIMLTHGSTLKEKILEAFPRWRGSYSLVVADRRHQFVIRDPSGNRPLNLGIINGNGYVVASESHAIKQVGGTLIREVVPGEIAEITEDGINTILIMPALSYDPVIRRALCLFEYVYLSRPESEINGRDVHEARFFMGYLLGKLAPVDADYVTAVPDNARPMAEGFVEGTGTDLPLREVVLRERDYTDRTFMHPEQSQRRIGARQKYSYLDRRIKDQRIIVVDDSLVRGNTTEELVSQLWRRGAREVHVRIASPPIRYPCNLGVDFASYGELAAAGKSIEEVRQRIGATTLVYLPLEELIGAVGNVRERLCTACFTGEYPIPSTEVIDKYKFSARTPLQISAR